MGWNGASARRPDPSKSRPGKERLFSRPFGTCLLRDHQHHVKQGHLLFQVQDILGLEDVGDLIVDHLGADVGDARDEPVYCFGISFGRQQLGPQVKDLVLQVQLVLDIPDVHVRPVFEQFFDLGGGQVQVHCRQVQFQVIGKTVRQCHFVFGQGTEDDHALIIGEDIFGFQEILDLKLEQVAA